MVHNLPALSYSPRPFVPANTIGVRRPRNLRDSLFILLPLVPRTPYPLEIWCALIHSMAPVTLHSRYGVILVHSELIHTIAQVTLPSWSAHGTVQYCLMVFSASIHTGSHAPLSLQSRSAHNLIKRYFNMSVIGARAECDCRCELLPRFSCDSEVCARDNLLPHSTCYTLHQTR